MCWVWYNSVLVGKAGKRNECFRSTCRNTTCSCWYSHRQGGSLAVSEKPHHFLIVSSPLVASGACADAMRYSSPWSFTFSFEKKHSSLWPRLIAPCSCSTTHFSDPDLDAALTGVGRRHPGVSNLTLPVATSPRSRLLQTNRLSQCFSSKVCTCARITRTNREG